jgi:hypothetical protein
MSDARIDPEPMKCLARWFPTKTCLLAACFGLLLSGCYTPSPRDKAFRLALREHGRGNFEQAFTRYCQIYFDERTLNPERRESTSFETLCYLATLGRRYAPAHEFASKERDKILSLFYLQEGPPSRADELIRLDSLLGDTNAAVALFKRLDISNRALAELLYTTAEPILVGAGEFGLARHYVGDGQIRLKQLILTYRMFRIVSESNRPLRGSSDPFFFSMDYYGRKEFVRRVVFLLTILERTGGHNQALALQKAALKVCRSKQIQTAIVQTPASAP